MQGGEVAMVEEGIPVQEPDDAIRFEDLTVDDDLPVIDRVERYTKSQIALQRLVHVKMMGETAELAGYVFLFCYIPMHDMAFRNGQAFLSHERVLLL